MAASVSKSMAAYLEHEQRDVPQTNLFTAGGLASGSHTITITWTGQNPSATATSWLIVDAIDAGA